VVRKGENPEALKKETNVVTLSAEQNVDMSSVLKQQETGTFLSCFSNKCKFDFLFIKSNYK